MSLSLSALLLVAVPAVQEPSAALHHATELHSVAAPAHDSGRFVSPVYQKFAQVRIQKRVIIRVPRRHAAMTMQLEDIQRDAPPVYKEKKIGRCLPMNNILGVQIFDGRELDLITTDRKRIRARLEKKCQARSFYSGFYMEKSPDGRICANRDILHSRTGSKCEIDRFRELVRQ